MSNDNIAAQVINYMGSQMDLIFSLSVAICGGIIALLFQLLIHNHAKPTSQVRLSGIWLIYTSFVLAGVSIIIGYLSRGAITSSIPTIYQVDLKTLVSWGSASFEGSCTLRSLFTAQFISFMLSIISLFCLLCKNLNKLKGG